MAVFIELVTNILQNYYADNISGQTSGKSRAGRSRARRPVRGLEIKDDTYAMIKVIGANGVEIPLIDSGSRKDVGSGYSNFILQEVTEQRMEKKQILETFGDAYVFFFGEAPKMLQCTALLVNSNDFNWEAEWWENYDKYFRGTKLVEMGARCYLFYDDTVVEGYMLMANAKKTSQQPLSVGLSFQFFVTAYSNISLTSNNAYPVRSSVLLPDGVDLTAGNSREQLTTHLRNAALLSARGRLTESSYDAFYSSTAFAADVDRYLFQLSPEEREALLNNYIYLRGKPLRGKITDNEDEYIGGRDVAYDNLSGGLPSPEAPTVRSSFEIEDLFRKSIETLACFGADVNNPKSMTGLGLGVSFGAVAGVSLGGSKSKASAVYGPQPNNGYGYGYGYEYSKENDEYGLFAGIGVEAYVGTEQDPLGSIFGPPKEEKDPRYTEGAGDPYYGYPSDFGGPGFGQAGFGDLGGLGFGSGLGESGDPGFKDFSKFTYAAEDDYRSAMERFLDAKNQTCSSQYYAEAGVDENGQEYSRSGEREVCTTDTSSKVEGDVTAFALISAEGTLDPTGTYRNSPEAISELQRKRRFGLADDNPFGVECLEPEEEDDPFSYKKNWSWP